ncbi:MAG TPA: YihA family ribosome biogenesis GTP-binding protein [Clostridiales bacterium]|nr:YihA family ribosome biogenesis GTP-binding protein [Clostridiales bacterium]
MKIINAKFLTTVANQNLLQNTKCEFAFVGKSNVGKSSLINALCGTKSLARTGKTAGVTKNINYFSINNGAFCFVDLPGYGYHTAGKTEENKWAEILEYYLLNSKNLKCVFVLVDSRHEPSDNDRIMLKYLNQYAIPFAVVGTKCDKLKKNDIAKSRQMLAHGLALGESNVILSSSAKKDGIKDIFKVMDNFI